MKLKFLGAARTVTGSCFVLEVGGKRMAVDMGMHQGNKATERRNWDMTPYDMRNLDAILVTHAHIDHSGLLPKAVAEGFKGDVFLTPPTADLLRIMLADSAHIQEMEAQWENRKRSRKGKPPIEPLYTQGDAEAVEGRFVTKEYHEHFNPIPGVEAQFLDAGHILGSSIIKLKAKEDGRELKVVFSGDLGRPDRLLVEDPDIVKEADVLLLESTYGDRNHKDVGSSRDELAAAIERSYAAGEKVIIPAFAVERSQEIIYTLFCLRKEGRLPADMPVFLDSPLAIRATKIFMDHPEYLDEDTREHIQNGEHPLKLPNLKFTLTAQESRTLNTLDGPAIIISASGMANAGRIRHHLKHNLWRPGASIVFAGFQAKGTTGRHIVDGARYVRLFGEDVAVRAKIYTIGGFSAHAGQEQILEWVSHFAHPGLRIFLTHGETLAQSTLSKLLNERFKVTVHAPDYLEENILLLGRKVETREDPRAKGPAVDWDYLVSATAKVLDEVEHKLDKAKDKPGVEQSEMKDKLLAAHEELLALLAEMD